MTAALTEDSEDYDPMKALALVEVTTLIVDDIIEDDYQEGHAAILGDENCDKRWFHLLKWGGEQLEGEGEPVFEYIVAKW